MVLRGFLTVDPGEHTGWAYWSGTNKPLTGQIRPAKTRELEPGLIHHWGEFKALLASCRPCTVIIEGVEIWEGSLVSMTSAKRGNLFKLAYLVGGYTQIANSKNIEVEIIPARRWKGQLTKDAVRSRVKRFNGQLYRTDHITDAVGIGVAIMGKL